MGVPLYENVAFFKRERKSSGCVNAVTVCHAYVTPIRHFKINAFLWNSQSAVSEIPQTVAVALHSNVWKWGIVKTQGERRIFRAEITRNEKPVRFFYMRLIDI